MLVERFYQYLKRTRNNNIAQMFDTLFNNIQVAQKKYEEPEIELEKVVQRSLTNLVSFKVY